LIEIPLVSGLLKETNWDLDVFVPVTSIRRVN
jgi:hypothetical protein